MTSCLFLSSSCWSSMWGSVRCVWDVKNDPDLDGCLAIQSSYLSRGAMLRVLSSRALPAFQTALVSSSVPFPDVLLGQAVMILFPDRFLHPRAPGAHSRTLGECPGVFEALVMVPLKEDLPRDPAIMKFFLLHTVYEQVSAYESWAVHDSQFLFRSPSGSELASENSQKSRVLVLGLASCHPFPDSSLS